MKIGIIGTGNMGSILVDALLESKTVKETDVKIYNRTIEKAYFLQKNHPQIEVCSSLHTIVKGCQLLFVCVKPGDMYPLFLEIKKWVSSDKCIISITSPISVKQMDSVFTCNTARFIPSITNKVLSGVSLISFGASCSDVWKDYIWHLANNISEGIEIDNHITRVSSDIVSCGPAFFSYLAQAFINGATTITEIDEKTATSLTEKMLIGLGELLKSGQYSLPTLQEKVCVKGGITGEGIKVFEEELGDVFEQVFSATQHKFNDELKKIEKQFQHNY